MIDPLEMKNALESYARPHLPLAVRQAAREGMKPQDYYLLIEMDDPREGAVIPRRLAAPLIALARTATLREELETLFSLPCEPSQLLVVVTDGTHAEGKLLQLPTIATPSSNRVTLTTSELAAIESYEAAYAPTLAGTVDAEGGRLSEYVAILRFPADAPVLLKRETAREGLVICGFGDVIGELDAVASNADELLCLYKVKGTPSWSKLQFGPR